MKALRRRLTSHAITADNASCMQECAWVTFANKFSRRPGRRGHCSGRRPPLKQWSSAHAPVSDSPPAHPQSCHESGCATPSASKRSHTLLPRRCAAREGDALRGDGEQALRLQQCALTRPQVDRAGRVYPKKVRGREKRYPPRGHGRGRRPERACGGYRWTA